MSKDDSKDDERIIGRWFIGETLGKGGYSFVKKGTDVKTGKLVALKFMEKADKSWIKEQGKQVETEIGSLKNIKHKNVMKLYAYNLNAQYPTKEKNVFKDTILLVLEYAPGGELFDILYYTSKLDPMVSRTYFQQMIDGIEACHKANVIHRDLKPQNLLLDGKYSLKITDFGLSKVIETESDSKMDTFYVGTRGYQAPELIKEKEYDYKCDIFSMGVILFILLAGYPPFEQASKEDKWFKPLIKNNYDKFWKCHLKSNAAKVENARKLIQSMLTYNPKERATIEQIKESEFYQEDVMKQSELIKHLKDRHKKTEKKRLLDLSKQKELEHSINPNSETCRDVIKDGHCEVLYVPDSAIFNPIYTFGDKLFWKQVYGNIILQVTKSKGEHTHNTSDNSLHITLNVEDKSQVEFSFKVYYSSTYYEKHEDLTADDAYVFVVETKRLRGNVFLYHAILKKYLFSKTFHKVIKGLPKWVTKYEKKLMDDNKNSDNDNKDAAADNDDNDDDENEDDQKSKDKEDDEYYKLCEEGFD